MKRKMIGATTAYMSGLFFASFFKGADMLLVIPIFVMVGIAFKIKGFVLRDFSICLFFFAISFGAFNFYTYEVYDRIMLYDSKIGNFSGEITDIKLYDGGYASYILKGKINGETSAKVTLYREELGAVYGDTVIIEDCLFSKITGDYLFDTESYYKADKIFLSVSNSVNLSIVKNNSAKLKNFLVNYREKIIYDFKVTLGDDCGSFLAGMVFGQRQGMGDNIKTALYKSGIGHVLAVSGLHVSVMTSFLMFLLERLKVNKFVSFGIMNVFVFILVMIADVPVSVVRASIMLDLVYSAPLFRRQNDTFNSLAIATFLICIVNPYVIYSTGFLLSILGTFGIGVFSAYVTKDMERDTVLKKLAYLFVTAFCTALFVMPLSIKYFDETSIVSPFMNVFAVPFCTVAMVIGMIYALTGGILPILKIAEFFIKPVIYISDKVARLSFLHISSGGISKNILISIWFSCILIFFIFSNRKVLKYAVTVSMIVFLAFNNVCHILRENKFIVTVLGRGNNAVVIVSHNGSSDIIDLSGHYRSASYVAKYLDEYGIGRVNNLFLTSKVQSQYTTYLKKLEFVEMNDILISGSLKVKENDRIFGDSFKISYDDYYISYSNDLLSIVYGDCKLFFTPAKSDNVPNGFTVFYGNIPKDKELKDGNVYLDSDRNNFEIVMSSEVYSVRGL